MWSYQLGLQEGWMPTDPQKSTGQCSNFGTFEQFDGPLKAWQTGGAGAGQINPASSAAWAQWPAPTIPNAGDAAQLPIYTATGAVPTLPPPTFTASVSINAGNGWFDPSDTGLAPASIQGCPYPDSWNAVGVAVPQVPACTQGTFQKREANPMPAVTAAP
jgi:glucan 1,3-beta-glucosidase